MGKRPREAKVAAQGGAPQDTRGLLLHLGAPAACTKHGCALFLSRRKGTCRGLFSGSGSLRPAKHTGSAHGISELCRAMRLPPGGNALSGSVSHVFRFQVGMMFTDVRPMPL